MGTLGSASIQLNLDRSQFDSDLTKLQSQDAGTVAYRVKLDTKDFERQIKGLRIEQPIFIPLEIDTKTLDQQIKKLSTRIDPIKIDLAPNVADFQEKLRRLGRISPIEVDIKVDESKVKQQFQVIGKYAAEGFTQGFSGVEGAGKSAIDSMVKSVNQQLGIQSPSRVFREIGKYAIAGLMQGLESADTHAVINKITSEFRAIDLSAEVRLVADVRGLQRQVTGELVAKVSVEVSGDSTSKLSNSIADAVAHAVKKTQSKGLFGSLLSMVMLPLKVLGAGLGHTFEGLFLGAGLPLGESLGAGIAKGVNKALKGKFNANLSQIGINLTDLSKADWNLAKAIDALFIEGNPIGKARKTVKELQDVFADLKILVAPGTIEKVVEFGKLSSAGPREFKKQYVAAAKRAKSEGRELTAEQFTEELKPKAEFKAVGTAIKLAGIPFGFKTKVMSFEAQRQIEARASRLKIPEISEPSVTLVTGGFQKQKGRGAYEIAELAKSVLPESHVMAIPNTYTDRKATDTHSELLNFIKSLGMDVPPALLDTIQNTEKLMGTAAYGYNPDAIKIAAYARAVQRKYPDKPVNALTFSGGTYPLDQAIQFDTDAGGKAKGIGLGAGLYGLTGRHNPNYRAMIGEQDPLGFPFQLLSPTKNTRIIPNFADVTSMDVHNPKRYFANSEVQEAMSQMFTGFVAPEGTDRTQEGIFSLINRKVSATKHMNRLNRFMSDPSSVPSHKVDESFGELADFISKNSAFGRTEKTPETINEDPKQRTLPELTASQNKLALDAQNFYSQIKETFSKTSSALAGPLGIPEQMLSPYEPEQRAKVIRAVSKVSSESPNLARTVNRLQGSPDDEKYAFYTRDNASAIKRTEDFKGLINYLRGQVLTGLPADIDKLAQEYLKYLEDLQTAIVKLVKDGEAIAPEILAQKDKLTLLSFNKNVGEVNGQDAIKPDSAIEKVTQEDKIKPSLATALEPLQLKPELAAPIEQLQIKSELATPLQPLQIKPDPSQSEHLKIKSKKIEDGFKEYSSVFKNQVLAAQELGDSTEINKQIQDFVKYAATAKKELEEIRQILIGIGEIEKSDSQNPASKAKKTITSQTKKTQQELGKSGNPVELVSLVDKELAQLEQAGRAIGQNLPKAMALGIEETSDQATAAIEVMALETIKVTKKTFGIQSPSKEFEEIGENVGEGFELGIKSSMQKADEELLKLVNSSVNTAKGASILPPPPPPPWASKAASALPPPPPPPWASKAASALPPPLPQSISPVAIPDQTNIKTGNKQRDPNRGIGAFLSGLKVGKEGRDTAANAITDIFTNIKNKAEQTAPILKNFGGLLSSLLKGFFAFQGVMILQNILSQLSVDAFKAFVELDRLKTALNFASGGSAGGAQNLAFVKKTVEDLKIPLQASIQGFTRLAGATRGSALEGKQAKQLFEGLSEASTVLSLSAEDTSGTLESLSKAMSQGRIGADLFDELGTRIPGVLGIAARAMGTTEEEFNRLKEAGRITPEDFLPKFGRQLHNEFGEAAKGASDNAPSAIFGVQNSFSELQQNIGEAVSPAAMAGLNALSGILKGLTSVVKELEFIFLSVATALSVKMYGALKAVFEEIILTKFAGASLGGGFAQLASTINNSFSAKLTTGIFAVLEIVNLLNQAINTELVTSFRDAADAAKRAAEESRKAFEKPKPESSDALGRFVDKNVIEPLNSSTGTKIKTFGEREQANRELGGKQALDPVATSWWGRAADDWLIKPNKSFTRLTKGDAAANKLSTWGEYERDSTINSIDEQGQANADFLASSRLQLAQFKKGVGEPGKLRGIDAKLKAAEAERATLKANIKRDFTDKGQTTPSEYKQRLESQNLKINELNDQRSEAGKPLTLKVNETNRKIATIKSQIEGLSNPDRIDNAGGEAAAEKQRQALTRQLEPLKQFKANLEAALAALRIDPVLAFTNALRKLNLAFAESQEKNQLSFDASKAQISTQQVTGFKSNKLSTRMAAVNLALQEKEKAGRDYQDQQTISKGMDEEVNRPQFQTTLQRLGVSPDASAAKIDDVLKNTTDESDKGILEKLKASREQKNKLSASKGAYAESMQKVQSSVQDYSLFQIDESAANSRAAIQKNENEYTATFKNAVTARVMAEEVANEQIARIQLGSTKRQQKSLGDQLAALYVYHDQGKVSAEEFAKRERDLTLEQSNLEKQEAENRLAVQQSVLTRRTKELEFANKKAEALNGTNQADSTRQAKEKLLSAGLTPLAQDQFALSANKIDQTATLDKIALIQKKLADNRQLYNDKLINSRDYMEQEYALNQELAQANLQLTDQKITAEEKYRETVEHAIGRIMQAEDNRYKSITSQMDSQKAGLELYNQSLERTVKLEESRYNLSKASSNAAIARLETSKGNADSALGLVEKLKDPKLNPSVKAAIKAQLQSLGFNSYGVTVTPATVTKASSGTTPEELELQIKQKTAQIEEDIANKKQIALQMEQEFQRKALENDLKRQKIAAEMAVFDAQSGQLTAAKSKLDAEAALRIAKIKKDPEAIAAAKVGVEIADRQVTISNKRLDNAISNLNSQDELNQNATQAQGISQASDTEKMQAENAARRRATALDLVETGAKSGNIMSLSSAEDSIKPSSPQFQIPQHIDFNQMPPLERKPGETLFDAYQRQREGMKLPKSAASNIPPTDQTSQAVKSSRIQPHQESRGNQFVEALKMVNQGIEQRLDALNSAIIALANTPRSLTVSTANPVDDAAKILNDFSRGQVLRAGA